MRDPATRRAVAQTAHPFTSGVDISSVAFWSQDFAQRDEGFARLRASAPISWQPALETPGLAPRYREAGFWAVTTAEHLRTVSRDSARFSSALGQVSVRPTPYRLEPTMLVTDPPVHTVLRSVLGGVFSPAGLARLAPRLERAVRQVVLRSTVHREFDLVQQIAAVVPARVLAILFGVPAVELDRFVTAVDAYAGAGIPSEVAYEGAIEQWMHAQSAYLTELIEGLERFRRRVPSDDVISVLLQQGWSAAAGDRRLLSTALLLLTAGHDTMKQLISLSVLALARNPGQRAQLTADFAARFDPAFDELVRYASPVLSFARTVTQDTVLGGVELTAGDKVALFYCSGNRDERAFTDPAALDLARLPNRHVALGGGGVHFCLGGALARMQLRTVLATLHARMPDPVVGVPVYGFNDSVHRVERLPVARS